MKPDPYLLCPAEEKARREAANGVEQVDYISHLVNDYHVVELRESHVLELHRLAVDGIYPCAGTYRNAHRQVHIDGSRHQIPHESRVPGLVRDLLDHLNASRESMSAVERAAYALWRLNWIHPFAGGNGRTSRALTYLILCIDMQMMLPGVRQVPTLIYERRIDYVKALRVADAGEIKTPGKPDLSAMSEFVREVVTLQLASAIYKLTNKP